ncbi:glycoside hydrolase family 10 protein [Tychonema sp. BBK16]|uniref:glycoside hydrolase family 10 protein n=1 Tax=Tychonema sp. BBK16 TaxID=2699888 RepID=UPI001F17A30D|nr:glycoside hydrolase family 10 protein [Tychonema sp. BBK16]MCF6373749.1 family 10 glycosylhydrolase [Tychonema sp. BBK16]
MTLRIISRGWLRSTKSLLPLLFAVSFILILVANNFSMSAVSQEPRQEIRGVWMTTNDKDILRDKRKVADAVSKLKQLNFNTIYPVVWNSGYVMYPSAVAQNKDIQPFVYRGLDGQDMLADLIAQSHRQGLLVIPWFEFGFMAPPTSELALNNPDWLTQKQDGSQTSNGAGGEVVWLNPFHPEVQKFITELVLEVTTQYNGDGIQFDDHMSLPSEFGYDAYTVALYTKETKKAPPTNFDDPAWVRWRANKITAFMSQLNQAVKAVKPNAIFSISPNYYEFAYKHHLQDWLAWVRLDIADELIVQVYRPDLESFISKINRPEMQETQKKIPTGVGIMTGLRNRPVSMQQIQSQVRAVQQYGLGVAFFYYESLWEDAPESLEDRLSRFRTFFPISAFRTALQIPRRAATFPPPPPPKPDTKNKPNRPKNKSQPLASPTTKRN